MHPLGGLARRATLVEKLRRDADGVLVVDAGDDLNGPPVPVTQKEQRGRLILAALRTIGLDAWQPGEKDRDANVPLVGIPTHGVFTRAGVRIGVLSRDLETSPVAPIAREALELRRGGAELVVALLHGSYEHVKAALALAVGEFRVDVAVVSHGRMYSPLEKVGETWLAECPPQDKQACELDLHIVGNGKDRLEFVDGGQRSMLENMVTDQKRELVDLDARAQSAAPSVRQFIEQRREGIKSTIATSEASLAKMPSLTTASWIENQNVPLNADVADAPAVMEMIRAYKDDVARLPPPVGRMEDALHAGYAGAKKCAECHAGAYAFWQGTKHAHAMATLVAKKSDKDPACTSCHITGGLLTVPDVQCEACHGAAQGHVQRPTVKGLVRRDVGEAICKSCHTQSQAPDFQFAAFRAAIVGPGHGGK